MEVIATELWRYRISVPGLGAVVPPPPGATATVSQQVGAWLIAQGYAAPAPLSIPPPPPPSEEWHQKAIAYLEEFDSSDAIAAAIKGVGPETAKDLFDLPRPLQWETVRGVLNSRQSETLRKLVS